MIPVAKGRGNNVRSFGDNNENFRTPSSACCHSTIDSRPEGCICYSPDDLCTVRVVVPSGRLLPVELDAAQPRCTVTIITVMTQTECSSRRTCPSTLMFCVIRVIDTAGGGDVCLAYIASCQGMIVSLIFTIIRRISPRYPHSEHACAK